MPGKRGLTVRDYLRELKENKKGKPVNVRGALDTYVELWDAAIEKGVVSSDDDLASALSKLEEAGGLYQAAG
jgi:hypothetical protein